MKHNLYYTVYDSELPLIFRTDYHGFKFDEVINASGKRTFREAKAQYKKYLKQTIKMCQEELKKVDNLTIDDLETDSVL